MKKENIIKSKSYDFALAIINLYQNLSCEKNSIFVLNTQLVKSGTSIGANIEEAVQAQSKKDFIAKFSISLKEAHETHYWLRLFRDAKIIKLDIAEDLIEKVEELIKIMISIIKTSKNNLN